MARSAGRLALLATLAAFGSAACSSTTPSATATVVPAPDSACLLTTEPGPADEPPRGGGDLIDLSDYGGGRYRLCLSAPVVRSFEYSAWCAWTPDRATVREVNGLPELLGDVAFDANALLAADELQLSLKDPDGTVSTYLAAADHLGGEVGDGGRAGYRTFEVALHIDPQSGAPPGAPPTFTGSMRWDCGEPPAPR